jgi:hypothetical protein
MGQAWVEVTAFKVAKKGLVGQEAGLGDLVDLEGTMVVVVALVDREVGSEVGRVVQGDIRVEAGLGGLEVGGREGGREVVGGSRGVW